MKRFLLAALLIPLNSNASNQYINTVTHLNIDESASTLSYSENDGFYQFSDNGNLIYVPSTPTKTANFGGIVEVHVSESYIDTLYDGTPKGYTEVFRTLSLKFTSLSLPDQVSDFVDSIYTGSFTRHIGTFIFDGQNIPGSQSNFCETQIALGYMCSISTFRIGSDDSLLGTFIDNKLNVNGAPAHGYFGPYYSFHLEASTVPLPGGVILFITGMMTIFGSRKRLSSPI